MNKNRNTRQSNNNNKNKNKKNNNSRRRQPVGIDRNRALISAYGNVRQNQLNFLPPWIEAPMRYSDIFSITVAGGLSAEYIYRANSLFDPDRTSTGHQPLGFDTMAQAYSHYRVDRLEWYIEFPSLSLTYSAGVCMVNGVATIGSLSALMEYPTARLHTVGFNGAPPGVFTGHKMLPPFNGKSMLSYHTDDVTGAQTNTNPVEVIDLHIVINNPNALTGITVQINVNLKYRAVFYDPLTPVQSLNHNLLQNQLKVIKSRTISETAESLKHKNLSYDSPTIQLGSSCNRDSSTTDFNLKQKF